MVFHLVLGNVLLTKDNDNAYKQNALGDKYALEQKWSDQQLVFHKQHKLLQFEEDNTLHNMLHLETHDDYQQNNQHHMQYT